MVVECESGAGNAALYINSSDTSWLKISADGVTAHPILISGSVKIDCKGNFMESYNK